MNKVQAAFATIGQGMLLTVGFHLTNALIAVLPGAIHALLQLANKAGG